MSMPELPRSDPSFTREAVINQIISSIAMEELGLSHVINAEGEKIQYALGTLAGVTGPAQPLTTDELLALNQSVRDTLEGAMQNQLLLKGKLQAALSASIMQGPTGPAGPMTTILDSYNTYDELIVAHPTGNPGDAYLVGGMLYVWNSETQRWEGSGDLTGPTGATGPLGPITSIMGSYDSYQQMVSEHPTGNPGEAYLVNGEIYVWSDANVWHPVGNLIGPTGPQGEQGPAGPISTILGSYDNYQDFIDDHSTGTLGDAYLVAGALYAWSADLGTWIVSGNLIGPTGPAGPQGQVGEQGPTGPQGPAGESGVGGTIKGTVATEGDLDAIPGNAGDLYLVGTAQTSYAVYLWHEDDQRWEEVGPFVAVVGPTGPQGEQGLSGPTGPASVILGQYNTYEELMDQHPFGTPGDVYLVGGELYVWGANSTTWEDVGNLMGPTGPTGAEAQSYTIIPFASQKAPKMYSNGGNSTRVALLGFSYLDTTNALYDPDIGIVLESGGSFNLGSAGNRQLVFSMPFDMKIVSVYASVGNYEGFAPTGTVYPYVQLYRADANSNTFFPIPETLTSPVNGLGPGAVGTATMRPAFVTDLNVEVPAGTRIAIGGLMRIAGDLTSQTYYMYYTGGIGLTRWFR